MRKITLLCDGTSDLCIIDILNWVIDENLSDERFQINAARELIPAHGRLRDRLKKVEQNHEPDIIICHRDSEDNQPEHRLQEIEAETKAANLTTPVIRAVPVRMIESWLLFDSNAIRCAASNRNGNQRLTLPRFNSIETLPDPKSVLFDSLRIASGLPPQRLSRFNVHAARHRIPAFVSDFSPLRALPSFSRFEEELIQTVREL